jgi:maleylacetoacetate isomerase
MPQLTLYHYWRSSCSWRVRWALALKGVAYQSVAVNLLKGEQHLPAYKSINPSGFLPTLVIDGKPFGESLALIEWIDERWPSPPLLPQDPISKLFVRQLAMTVVAGTQPLQNPATLAQVSADPGERSRHARFFIERGLTAYHNLMLRNPIGSAGTFSCGGHVTLADLCLIPQVYNALRFNVSLAAFPLIEAVYKNCLVTPECDHAAPHNQPDAQP